MIDIVVKAIKRTLDAKLHDYNELKSKYDTINQTSNFMMPDYLKAKMDNLLLKWAQFEGAPNETRQAQPASVQSKIEQASTKNSKSLLLPPSTSLSFTQIPIQSKDIDLISNDLFDWLLWIDHTLQSHVITVGDFDEIQQAINKYSVRENREVLKIAILSFFFSFADHSD
jgi:hypothetical protein